MRYKDMMKVAKTTGQRNSGHPNCRGFILMHDEILCQCLLQICCYSARSNLVLIWDSGELGVYQTHRNQKQKKTIIVGLLIAIRWLEAPVRENSREAPATKEQLQEHYCLKNLDFLGTICKAMNNQIVVKKRNGPEEYQCYGSEPT